MKELSNSGLYDVKNYADLGGLFVHILCIIQSSHHTHPYSLILLLIIVRSLRFRKVPFSKCFPSKTLYCVALFTSPYLHVKYIIIFQL